MREQQRSNLISFLQLVQELIPDELEGRIPLDPPKKERLYAGLATLLDLYAEVGSWTNHTSETGADSHLTYLTALVADVLKDSSSELTATHFADLNFERCTKNLMELSKKEHGPVRKASSSGGVLGYAFTLILSVLEDIMRHFSERTSEAYPIPPLTAVTRATDADTTLINTLTASHVPTGVIDYLKRILEKVKNNPITSNPTTFTDALSADRTTPLWVKFATMEPEKMTAVTGALDESDPDQATIKRALTLFPKENIAFYNEINYVLLTGFSTTAHATFLRIMEMNGISFASREVIAEQAIAKLRSTEDQMIARATFVRIMAEPVPSSELEAKPSEEEEVDPAIAEVAPATAAPPSSDDSDGSSDTSSVLGSRATSVTSSASSTVVTNTRRASRWRISFGSFFSRGNTGSSSTHSAASTDGPPTSPAFRM